MIPAFLSGGSSGPPKKPCFTLRELHARFQLPPHSSSVYKTATTPAIAMTAAAKLPTCLVSAAALPLAEAPEPELEEPVDEAPFAPVELARPVETAAPVVAVATIVVVQLQSEL